LEKEIPFLLARGWFLLTKKFHPAGLTARHIFFDHAITI